MLVAPVDSPYSVLNFVRMECIPLEKDSRGYHRTLHALSWQSLEAYMLFVVEKITSAVNLWEPLEMPRGYSVGNPSSENYVAYHRDPSDARRSAFYAQRKFMYLIGRVAMLVAIAEHQRIPVHLQRLLPPSQAASQPASAANVGEATLLARADVAGLFKFSRESAWLLSLEALSFSQSVHRVGVFIDALKVPTWQPLLDAFIRARVPVYVAWGAPNMVRTVRTTMTRPSPQEIEIAVAASPPAPPTPIPETQAPPTALVDPARMNVEQENEVPLGPGSSADDVKHYVATHHRTRVFRSIRLGETSREYHTAKHIHYQVFVKFYETEEQKRVRLVREQYARSWPTPSLNGNVEVYRWELSGTGEATRNRANKNQRVEWWQDAHASALRFDPHSGNWDIDEDMEMDLSYEAQVFEHHEASDDYMRSHSPFWKEADFGGGVRTHPDFLALPPSVRQAVFPPEATSEVESELPTDIERSATDDDDLLPPPLAHVAESSAYPSSIVAPVVPMLQSPPSPFIHGYVHPAVVLNNRFGFDSSADIPNDVFMGDQPGPSMAALNKDANASGKGKGKQKAASRDFAQAVFALGYYYLRSDQAEEAAGQDLAYANLLNLEAPSIKDRFVAFMNDLILCGGELGRLKDEALKLQKSTSGREVMGLSRPETVGGQVTLHRKQRHHPATDLLDSDIYSGRLLYQVRPDCLSRLAGPWMLHPNRIGSTRGQLCGLVYFTLHKVRYASYWVWMLDLRASPRRITQWVVVIHDPHCVLEVLSKPELGTLELVVEYCFNAGFRFNTVSRPHPTENTLFADNHRVVQLVGHKAADNPFVVGDFELYEASLQDWLQRRSVTARAAVAKGGILAQICKEHVSLEDMLRGPSEMAMSSGKYRDTFVSDEYGLFVDDVVTPEEIDYIIGLRVVLRYPLDPYNSGYSGVAPSDIAYHTYWPHPDTWHQCCYDNGGWSPAAKNWMDGVWNGYSSHEKRQQPSSQRKWSKSLRNTTKDARQACAAVRAGATLLLSGIASSS